MKSFALFLSAVLSTTALADHHGDHAATKVDVFESGSLSVPAKFKKVPAKSRIVQHEFMVPGEGEVAPARMTMMAAGGGVEANLNRWKGQFGGEKEVGDTEEFKSGTFTVHTIDVAGTYADSMGGGPFSGGKKVMRDDYAMLGAILVSEKGPSYFVKMIGPAEVVMPNKEAFMGMVKAVGETKDAE